MRLISPPHPSNFRGGDGKEREGKDRGGERRGNEEGRGRKRREGRGKGSPSLPYVTNTTLVIT